jgi:hypothetical protein
MKKCKLIQKKGRFLLLGGAIFMTLLIPRAFEQEYFRYNPYLVPIFGLIAIILYLLFLITSDKFNK